MRLGRVAGLADLTARKNDFLRSSFITLLGAGEQKQAIAHPSQFKKDKEFEQAPVSLSDARYLMRQALRRWATGEGASAPGSSTGGILLLI